MNYKPPEIYICDLFTVPEHYQEVMVGFNGEPPKKEELHIPLSVIRAYANFYKEDKNIITNPFYFDVISKHEGFKDDFCENQYEQLLKSMHHSLLTSRNHGFRDSNYRAMIMNIGAYAGLMVNLDKVKKDILSFFDSNNEYKYCLLRYGCK